jgi:RNA polymerase sigma-70 factor (ECF subfamily)
MPISIAAIDEALLSACRRGESAAQYVLYQKLASDLLGVCMRYCPTQTEAEDALQETFVKIFTRLDQYRGEGPFEAWAHRVAVTTTLNATKQHRLRHPASSIDLDELTDQLPASDSTGLEQLAASDLIAVVQTLPLGYRTVLNLYAVEGYSHPEIAALLGITESTSKSQLTRARRLLETRLVVAHRIRTP